MPVAEFTRVHDKHVLMLLCLFHSRLRVLFVCDLRTYSDAQMHKHTPTVCDFVHKFPLRLKASASVACKGLNDATGPWAQRVFSPFQRSISPFWEKMERKVQARIDSLPPGVAAFLDVKTSESFLMAGLWHAKRRCWVHGPFAFTSVLDSKLISNNVD